MQGKEKKKDDLKTNTTVVRNQETRDKLKIEPSPNFLLTDWMLTLAIR